MKRFAYGLLAILVIAALSQAQERPRLFGSRGGRSTVPCPPVDCPPAMWPPASPLTPPQPGQQLPGTETPRPGTDTPQDMNAAQPPSSNAFNEALASAGESGTQPGASYQPGFFGDLIASSIGTGVFLPELGVTTFIASPNASQLGAIKFAEGDSPRPQNRVYYQYNYFGGVEVNMIDPDAPLMSVNRHVLGLEKTFLDSNASIGLRLPFLSLGGDSIAYQSAFVGDLTVITKYALLNNRERGNLVSAGLSLTLPTGGSPTLIVNNSLDRVAQPRYRPVGIQPFIGYIWNPLDRAFVQGYHSINIPTVAQEPTFMSNGVSLGYWLFRSPESELIQGIVPTLEVHVNTPFGSRDVPQQQGQTVMRDSVNLTMGGYIVMPRSLFGGAVGVPLAFGPHQIEAVATYTLRY